MTTPNTWLDVYKSLIAGQRTVCPACSADSVQSRFVGNDDTRLGFAAMWCQSCKSGANLSRVKFPAGVPMIGWGQAESMPDVVGINWVASTDRLS